MNKNKINFNSPLVSVLVVNFNKKELLKVCLESLKKQTYENIEIIVVDNGSEDGSASMVRTNFPGVKLIASDKNLFFAGGNNLAYENSKGDIIFLLNNDTFLDPDVISKSVEFLKNHPKAGIVQNLIVNAQNPKVIDSKGSMFSPTGFLVHLGHQKENLITEPRKIFAAKGASLFLKREVVEASGGLFDENYTLYFEDTDLCWRALLAGFEVYFLPGTKTYHHEGKSTSKADLGFIDFHSFKNRINAIITNSSLLTLGLVLPIHLYLCAILAIIYLFIRPSTGKGIFRAIFWNIKYIFETIKKRNRIQKLRKRSDFLFLPKLSIVPSPLYILKFFRFYTMRKH